MRLGDLDYCLTGPQPRPGIHVRSYWSPTRSLRLDYWALKGDPATGPDSSRQLLLVTLRRLVTVQLDSGSERLEVDHCCYAAASDSARRTRKPGLPPVTQATAQPGRGPAVAVTVP